MPSTNMLQLNEKRQKYTDAIIGVWETRKLLKKKVMVVNGPSSLVSEMHFHMSAHTLTTTIHHDVDLNQHLLN